MLDRGTEGGAQKCTTTRAVCPGNFISLSLSHSVRHATARALDQNLRCLSFIIRNGEILKLCRMITVKWHLEKFAKASNVAI